MQDNLLYIEISYLIPDMITVNQTVQKLLEESIIAFLEPAKKK
jgi:hypothetical protein